MPQIQEENQFRSNFFFNYDHAEDRLTWISQTGIILYCNSAPTIWYSKRQIMIESSTAGAEFVALQIAADLIVSLIYNLIMIGVNIK